MAYSTRKLSLVSEQEPAAKAEPHLSDAARPLGTVAATLRAARLAHGSTLPEISDSLRIRLAYLEAIEDGRFDELPGNVYAIGFIRTYADHLGLDSRHLIEKYKEETEQPQSQQELHFLAAEPERRIPGGSLMLVALLMAAVTYGVWFYVSSTDRGLVDLIPDFPDRFNALLVPNQEGGNPVELAQPSDDAADVPTDQAGSENLTATLRSPLEDNTFGSPPPEDPFPTTAQPGEPVEQLAAPTPAPAESADDEGEFRVSGVQPSLTPGFDIPTAPAGLTDPLEGSPSAEATGENVLGESVSSDDAPVEDLLGEDLPSENLPGEGAPTTDVAEGPLPQTDADAPSPTTVDSPIAENAADTTIGTNGNETGPAPVLAEQDLNVVPETPGQSAAIAAARPPGPPTSPTFGGENEDSRVLINATAMSWVQVRDDAGNLVMTRVLQPGESYRVPNRPGLHMVTGNAGGIEIFVDGQPTPPFGRHGDVVRNIDLDPDALLNGTAAPN